MYIIKNFEITDSEIIAILQLANDKLLDTEFINLLQFANKLEFFTLNKSIYSEILREFISLLKNPKKAYTKLQVLLNNIKFSEISPTNFSSDYIKEILKTKIRSFIIFNTAEKIIDTVLTVKNTELLQEQKFWENINELEISLNRLREQLNFIEKKYHEFSIDNCDLSFNNNSNKIINSPIPDLIEYFETSRIYLISGLSKIGKSIFALNLFQRFYKQGNNVLYISLENTLRELISRFLCLYNADTNFYGKEFTLKDLINKEFFDDVLKKFQSLEKPALFKIIELPFANLFSIIQTLMENQYNYDIIFIDWIDLIDIGKKDNLFLALSQIIREIYNFAKENQKIIIAISQLNREAFNSDIKDSRFISRSWAKIETVDASIILDRIDQNKIYAILDCSRYLMTPKEKSFLCDFEKAYIHF